MKSTLLSITVLACMAGCESWDNDLTESKREPPPPPPPSNVDRAPPPILDDTAPTTPAAPRDQTMTQGPPADRDAGTNVTLQPTDRTFVEQAVSGGMFEVQSAEMALKQQNLSDDLKGIAQMIVDDHRMANDELKSIASNKGVTIPAEMQAKHKDQLDQLRQPNDVEFGAKFRQVQIAAHQDAITLFQEYVTNGRDAQLKAFAERTLPTLKKHLAELEGAAP